MFSKVGEIVIKIYRIIHNIKNKIGETDSEIEMWNIISANSHTSKYTISRDDNGMDISVDCEWVKYRIDM